jgi:hypothetical protein
MRGEGKTPASLPHRLLWFVALWTGGVAGVAVLAYLLRLVLR